MNELNWATSLVVSMGISDSEKDSAAFYIYHDWKQANISFRRNL